VSHVPSVYRSHEPIWDAAAAFDWDQLIDTTMPYCAAWLSSLPHRPVARPVRHDELVGQIDDHLPEAPSDVMHVIADLAEVAETGLIASPGPRYFGFVTGGAHPAALAADWLTSAWDQVAGSFVGSPTASVIEETTARWVLELLDLPRTATVGFTTGATMANFTALAAARRSVLERAGWDYAAHGTTGAPAVQVITGAQRHATIDMALRLLGIGTDQITVVPVDEQGRIEAPSFVNAVAATSGPVIAIAQAGNVSTGSFDPVEDIVAAVAERGAWLHVDGAFGLWARAARDLQHLTKGIDQADSWGVDAHKWLNVPYDCGLVIVRHGEAHLLATQKCASYAMASDDIARDGDDWVPEFSRRARAMPVYAVIRALGRSGIEDLVSRCCRLARRFAAKVAQNVGIEVLNDVVLNQVLLAFPVKDGDERFHTELIVRTLHKDGLLWAGTTEWNGRLCIRVSVSNWSTTERDIDRSADRLNQIVTRALAQRERTMAEPWT